jgi:nucleoid-associated protein YgaU
MLDVSEIINYRKYTWYDIEELDRLDLIAFEYLGDSRLWWVIADLNFDLIKDTQILHPGVKIRLPNAAALEELGI